MLFRPVAQPPPGLLAQRVNETARNGLGEHLVASIKVLCGHDLQGELAGIERAVGECFFA
jgi:hypothetical protein